MISCSLVEKNPSLGRFTVVDPFVRQDRTSILVLSFSLVPALVFWLAISTVAIPESGSFKTIPYQPVSVHLKSVEALVLPEIKPEPKDIPVLEPETILAAPVDRPRLQVEKSAVVAPRKPESQPIPPVHRRVYGVRKVYAKGLGTGTSKPAGLVTKLGNTIDGVADSLIATIPDLQGELASLSSVDTAPEPQSRIKPVYSSAMLQARVQGLVTAYLLVDVDGSVREIRITEDIGLDSRLVAEKALRGFRFKPAMKNGRPVAVWILHRIVFEYQE